MPGRVPHIYVIFVFVYFYCHDQILCYMCFCVYMHICICIASMTKSWTMFGRVPHMCDVFWLLYQRISGTMGVGGYRGCQQFWAMDLPVTKHLPIMDLTDCELYQSPKSHQLEKSSKAQHDQMLLVPILKRCATDLQAFTGNRQNLQQ